MYFQINNTTYLS